MEKAERKSVSGGVLEILKAILIAIILNLAFVLLFAALLKAVTLSDTVIRIVNQVVKVATILVSCLLSIKGAKKPLKCMLTGALILAISYFLFNLLSHGAIEWMSLLSELLLGAVVGLISGVITAVLRKSA